MTTLTQALHARGMRVTPQRLVIHEALGLVRRLRPGSGAALYDPRSVPHQHAVCRSCGAVQDIEAHVDATGAVAAARRAGFQPDGAETVVSGLCASCADGAAS